MSRVVTDAVQATSSTALAYLSIKAAFSRDIVLDSASRLYAASTPLWVTGSIHLAVTGMGSSHKGAAYGKRPELDPKTNQ